MGIYTIKLNGNATQQASTAVSTDRTTKCAQFRNLLHSSELEFLMEAHNGLSASIVEEAGFRGIWASGLSISAALGVRDSNEASWTQVLEVVEFMADATDIPILLDGDTGYGNFNNVRRLIRKLEQRGVAAVCIEDKIFPKTNSFIKGASQHLAEMHEFAGKIKAAKDSQNDSDFSVVARLEGFIANQPLEEVLKRADAYFDAGADALLVHSKKDTAEEIAAFVDHWDRPCPLVIVPTTYADTPTDFFRSLGISIGIWANHTMRSAVHAMQTVCAEIYQSESVAGLNGKIASVSEVFRLQDTDELSRAEKIYLPRSQGSNGKRTTHHTNGANGVKPATRSNGVKRSNGSHHVNGSGAANGTKVSTIR